MFYAEFKSIMLSMGGLLRAEDETRLTRGQGGQGNGVKVAVPLISGVSGICSPRPRGMAPTVPTVSLGTFWTLGGCFSGVKELVSAKQAGVTPPGRGALPIRNGRRRNISA